MLTVVGDLIADVIVLDAHTIEHATDNTVRITHTRGGSAANVAAAAARLGQHTRFIGRVGADAEGDALAHTLRADGVDVRVQHEGRTGSIVILVDAAGERTMLTDRGAAAELGPIEPEWLAGTRWLHLPVYGLLSPASRDAVLTAAALVRGHGGRISVDLSSVAAMRELGDALVPLIDRLGPDVVFANAAEAAVLDHAPIGTENTVVVVKRGGDPVILRAGGTRTEVPVEPVPNVVDSTGAGDAFAAGYLVAALGGALPAEAAVAGSRAARAVLTRAGA